MKTYVRTHQRTHAQNHTYVNKSRRTYLRDVRQSSNPDLDRNLVLLVPILKLFLPCILRINLFRKINCEILKGDFEMFSRFSHFTEIQLVYETKPKADKWSKYFTATTFVTLSVIAHYHKENPRFSS